MKDWDKIYKKLVNLMDRDPGHKEVQEAVHDLEIIFLKTFITVPLKYLEVLEIFMLMMKDLHPI